MNKNSKIHFAWIVLVGLCITVGLGKAGLNNTSGLFLSPVSEDIGTGVGNLSIYLSISSVVTMIFLPIGGKIMAKYDARLVLTISIILQTGAFAMFGMMDSVWGWYVFAVPLAVGGVFITVISGPILVQRWFKKRSGMALGVMTAIGGLFGMFTQPIVGGLISDLGWRSAYYTVGLILIIIIAPTIILLLRQSPEEKGLLPYGEKESNEVNQAESKQASGIDFVVAKKTPAFLLLGLFFFIITSVSSFTIHIPTYLVNHGHNVTFAGNMMAATMFGVFVGSLLFGYLSDRIGAKKTSLIAMFLGVISITLLINFTHVVSLIIVSLILFGFVTSSIGTLAPALTSALFGGRSYSEIYSTASMGLAVASIIALPAYGYVFDFTGSYTVALYIILGLLVVNIISIIAAFQNKEKLVQKGQWQG